MDVKKGLTPEQKTTLLFTLKLRFENNMHRHQGLTWASIQTKLETNSNKFWSINEMEKTGGEPDVVGYDKITDEYLFFDCSPESPLGRRSLCYDLEGLDSRKEFKPKNSAIELAETMGISILTEEQYRILQQFGKFDSKTSSWLQTPTSIRKLGGALFADFRYNSIFIYHNGAGSYYAVRGFRGSLVI